MIKDLATKLADMATTFFPVSQVRYVFEIGAKDARDGTKLRELFPLAEFHNFESRDTSSLDAFMDARGIGGIDILWLAEGEAHVKILQGLGKKLRTVRLIYAEAIGTNSAQGIRLRKEMRALLSPSFRFFDFMYAGKDPAGRVFVNKDIAPRWLGIVKKRIMRRFAHTS